MSAFFVRRWRSLFGLPDGAFVRLRCWLLGHDWYECDPECCGGTYCWRCSTVPPPRKLP